MTSFFFTDTAPTEIYTYCHTLSLHDALPILDTGSDLKVQYGRRERRLTLLRGRADFRVQHDSDRPFVVLVGDASVTATGTRFQVRTADDAGAVTLLEGEVVVAAQGGEKAGDRVRSEEHTSELQSLMRSSYPVFCLKNNTQPLHPHHHPHRHPTHHPP